MLRVMKTTLLGLMTLTALSGASAATYIGGSVGSGATIHYQTDLTGASAMRYGLNLDATNFDFSRDNVSVGGSIDYLGDFVGTGSALGGLTPYYGLGLGAGVVLGQGGGVSVYPHGTLGLRYNVTDPLSFFVEGNIGPRITVGGTNASNTRLGSGARIGLNYRLP
ncbi:hypothetical protein DEIGR_103099 [Deinococcus grandis]|uniref:Outer membrane protein beta-barrel domain-containing protein n=3 Tax=Deinococcaceae TaxID=183710 RepID=A0A117DP93_9DEIO|nr:hypothetical protein DEGR_01500 [Deinococcus grandis]GAQ23072.1 hypothetical protein DEIGR_103099 [Deinococcus grandis]GGN43063.1 hypothetical protein GCM10010842_30160 [Deinococcus daejeonensis]